MPSRSSCPPSFEPLRRYNAKYVIVAMPPHLAGRIQYSPPLPPMRNQLTERVPMGTTVKASRRGAVACLLAYHRAMRAVMALVFCTAIAAKTTQPTRW